MDDVTLKAFPSNEYEALAMLYVQSRDLTNDSPEELLEKYQYAYKKIKDHRNKQRNSDQWTL